MLFGGLQTFFALKRFVNSVNSLVYMVACLPTVLTLLGFLTGVDFLVLCKLMAVTKGFPTFFTPIGFLPCMDSLVFHKA